MFPGHVQHFVFCELQKLASAFMKKKMALEKKGGREGGRDCPEVG